MAKRRRATRGRLLESAHAVMSRVGVDAAKIKDITEGADVGFGTFYNYFASKDDLAKQVLDCVIDDLGRRNLAATRALRGESEALVIPVSTRLVMREALAAPMWEWWALRPDMLVDRMREGFGRFGRDDIRAANAAGIIHLDEGDIDSAWALTTWMMVGGIHDVVVGDRPADSIAFVAVSIMRMMGTAFDEARRISTAPLPIYPPPDINWDFALDAEK
jgi:AcrR family transcriptional regulator